MYYKCQILRNYTKYIANAILFVPIEDFEESECNRKECNLEAEFIRLDDNVYTENFEITVYHPKYKDGRLKEDDECIYYNTHKVSKTLPPKELHNLQM